MFVQMIHRRISQRFAEEEILSSALTTSVYEYLKQTNPDTQSQRLCSGVFPPQFQFKSPRSGSNNNVSGENVCLLSDQ